MGNYFCELDVCDVDVRLRCFVKVFCHAGDEYIYIGMWQEFSAHYLLLLQ